LTTCDKERKRAAMGKLLQIASRVVEIFFKALEFTQSLTEMSTGNIKKIKFLGNEVRDT
jgi:hypothetical protein